MSRRIAVVLMIIVLSTALVSTEAGRPDKNWKAWFPQISIGYSDTHQDLAGVFDDGWQIAGGATYWPEAWPIGLNMELAYSDYSVRNDVIKEINDQLEMDDQGRPISSGDGDIWSFTVNGMWSPKTGAVKPYLIGGIGAYRKTAALNTNAVFFVPPGCGIYWCYPGGWVPGQAEVGSETSTDFGWNFGIGIDFEVGSNGSQLFLEARYNSIDVSASRKAAYIPISLGYRW